MTMDAMTADLTLRLRPQLQDVRQIGPNRHRDISGRCSGCGDILFARFDGSERPVQSALVDRLIAAFAWHVAVRHRCTDQIFTAPLLGSRPSAGSSISDGAHGQR